MFKQLLRVYSSKRPYELMKIGLNREMRLRRPSNEVLPFPLEMIYVSLLCSFDRNLCAFVVGAIFYFHIVGTNMNTDCNTFLNRIQRNLIKIKFSDKMLYSHRTKWIH